MYDASWCANGRYPRLARADVSESGALSSLATANGLTQLERLYLYSSRTIADGNLTPLLPMRACMTCA